VIWARMRGWVIIFYKFYGNAGSRYNIAIKMCSGIKRKDGEPKQKRRCGRNPRIPFTAYQIAVLENEFQRNAYLGGTNDVNVLSERLRLSQSRVSIWHCLHSLFVVLSKRITKLNTYTFRNGQRK